LAFVNPADTHAIAALVQWAEPWRIVFNASVVISTGVLFMNVASIVCAGGLSLVMDRATLRPGSRDNAERERRGSAANRRLLIGAFVVAVSSGMLLFLSDVHAFIHLRTFWLKMGLVVLLINNALLADRHARRVLSSGPGTARGSLESVSRERVHARVSIGLWLLTLLAGTALTAG
jgi:hypothetical protein